MLDPLIAFARWRLGELRTTAVWKPVWQPDPRASFDCIGCGKLLEGRPLVGLVIGPGDDLDDQDRLAAGSWISARVVVIHADCAGIPHDDITEQLREQDRQAAAAGLPVGRRATLGDPFDVAAVLAAAGIDMAAARPFPDPQASAGPPAPAARRRWRRWVRRPGA